MAFVASGPHKYLVTAKHVLDGLWKRADLLRVLSASSPTAPSVPDGHTVDRAAVVWSSPSLDVAVLRAPEMLALSPNVSWFSADRGRRQITKLRQSWNPDAAPALMLAAGFPNFGRMVGTVRSGLAAELLGMLTLPAVIAQLKTAPDGKTQMVLELTHTDPMVAPSVDHLTKALHKILLEKSPTRSEDLGGLSGGPLVIPSADGDAEIVGVISEGSIMEVDGGGSLSMLRATPLDELVFGPEP